MKNPDKRIKLVTKTQNVEEEEKNEARNNNKYQLPTYLNNPNIATTEKILQTINRKLQEHK
jgi:flagellar basal body P-ring protein FlgI